MVAGQTNLTASCVGLATGSASACQLGYFPEHDLDHARNCIRGHDCNSCCGPPQPIFHVYDTGAMRPIARLGYMNYGVTEPENVFSINRPEVVDGKVANVRPEGEFDGQYR